MTNSNLLAAGPVASPGNFSPMLPVEPAADDAPPAEDFFGLISRASQKTSSSDNADESNAPDDSSSDDDTAPKNDAANASIAATLLAMMTQLGATELPKPPHLVSGDGKKGSPDNDSSDARSSVLNTGILAECRNRILSGPSPDGGKSAGADPKDETADAKASKGNNALLTPASPAADRAAKDAKSSSPGNSAPVADASPPNGKPLGDKMQTIEEKELANRILKAESPVSGAGTGVALNSQRMNLGDNKNEIAGRTVQKMQRAEHGQADSAQTAAASPTASDSAPLAGKKDASVPVVTLNTPVGPVTSEIAQGRGMDAAQPVDRSAAQVERVTQMVAREAVVVRQSGATGLAVSLKVDPHTELFLQLTHQNGQIQAMLRCERGNVTGLESHWGDLQESLARQNVQLLPFESKTPTAPSFNSSPAASSASSSFPQSSQRDGRSVPELNEEPVWSAPVARTGNTAAQPKTRILSPQGWESWA